METEWMKPEASREIAGLMNSEFMEGVTYKGRHELQVKMMKGEILTVKDFKKEVSKLKSKGIKK